MKGVICGEYEFVSQASSMLLVAALLTSALSSLLLEMVLLSVEIETFSYSYAPKALLSILLFIHSAEGGVQQTDIHLTKPAANSFAQADLFWGKKKDHFCTTIEVISRDIHTGFGLDYLFMWQGWVVL